MGTLDFLGRTSKVSPFSKDNLPLFWRRLHSLTGMVPLGAFLLVHLWTNSRAMGGPSAYEDRGFRTGTTPFFVFLEVLTLELPLAFHAIYGLALVVTGEPPSLQGEPKSSPRLVDRASSVIAFAFIAYHLWQFRIPVLLGSMREEDFFSVLCDTLSSTTHWGIPLAASLYLIGLAATSYHFAYGLAGLPSKWGIRVPEPLNRYTRGAAAAVGIVAFLVGASTVLYFATGSKLPGI